MIGCRYICMDLGRYHDRGDRERAPLCIRAIWLDRPEHSDRTRCKFEEVSMDRYKVIKQDEDILLCQIDDPTSPTPYVTYEVDEQGSQVFWGHYFASLREAKRDYYQRILRKI